MKRSVVSPTERWENLVKDARNIDLPTYKKATNAKTTPYQRLLNALIGKRTTKVVLRDAVENAPGLELDRTDLPVLKTRVFIPKNAIITQYSGYVVSKAEYDVLANAKYRASDVPLFPLLGASSYIQFREYILARPIASRDSGTPLTPTAEYGLGGFAQPVGHDSNAKIVERNEAVFLQATKDIPANSIITVRFDHSRLRDYNEELELLEQLKPQASAPTPALPEERLQPQQPAASTSASEPVTYDLSDTEEEEEEEEENITAPPARAASSARTEDVDEPVFGDRAPFTRGDLQPTRAELGWVAVARALLAK